MPDGAMREVAVRPDAAAIAEFADAVFRHADPAGFVAARSFYDDEKNGPPFQVMAAAVRDAPAVVALMAEAAADAARPVVVCPPVCTFAARAGAAEADLSEGLALTVDCDTVDPDVARPALIAVLGPPTVAVASGGLWTDTATGEAKDRLHLHWRLDEPTRDPAAHAALKEARRLAARIVGGDPSCAPLVHPIRWPGTVHRKAGPRLARIVALAADAEIALPEALAALRRAANAAPGGASATDAGSPHAPSRFGAAADLQDVAAALAAIPNNDLHWNAWVRVGLATSAATAGSAEGYAAWCAWSAKSGKHVEAACRERWAHFARHPAGRLGAGSLFHMARGARLDWERSRLERDRHERHPDCPLPGEGPRPLRRPVPPAPRFPVEALSGVLRDAVEAIHAKSQAPAAICANAVLAAASLAAQPHADVVLPTGSAKPLSLYCVTVAASGERKSSVDEVALAPIHRREAELRDAHEAETRLHRDDADAHGAAKDRLLKDKRLGADRAALRQALHNLGPAPEPPLAPILLADNPTVEGLERLFMVGQPSVGLFTAEGGKLIGGHLLNDDNRMKAGATLNLFWDGAPIPRIRAGDGATKMPGRRLAVHVMVQPEIAARMLCDPTLAGLGTLARFLVVAPETAAGRRLWREVPAEADLALLRYGEALLALLRKRPATGDRPNELRPAALPLSPAARAMWIAFHDEVERDLAPAGELAPVRALGAKLAEHAARIAGVLTLIEAPDAGEVGDAAMEAGIVLAQHYAREALRLVEAGAAHPDLLLAERLLAWLRARPEDRLHMVKVYQHGPSAIRDKETARRIVGLLEQHGWLRRLPAGAEVEGKPRRDAWEVVRS